MKRRIRVGEEFEGEILLIEDDAEAENDSKLRGFVTVVALGVGTMLLFGATVYGAMQKDFSMLSALWGAEGPIIGAVVGYYFK